MATVPVYECKRCSIQFTCHGSMGKPINDLVQIEDTFRALNSAPFIRAQSPISLFVRHSPCETTSGNRKFSGIGIGELVGFIDEKELK